MPGTFRVPLVTALPAPEQRLQGEMVRLRGGDGTDPGQVFACLADAAGVYHWIDLGANEVRSVNGQTGVVVLNADHIADDATAHRFVTAGQVTEIGANTAARHTHANKALLDTYTQTELNLAGAVTDRHTHANKALLDTYTQTNANLTSAVTNSHTHGNKATLDATTASFTTAKDTKLTGIETGADVTTQARVAAAGINQSVALTSNVGVISVGGDADGLLNTPSLPAGSVWFVSATVLISRNVTNGCEIGMTIPSGSSMRGIVDGHFTGFDSTPGSALPTTSGLASLFFVQFVTGNAVVRVNARVVIGGTAGFVFVTGRRVADSGSMSALAGSVLHYWRDS